MLLESTPVESEQDHQYWHIYNTLSCSLSKKGIRKSEKAIAATVKWKIAWLWFWFIAQSGVVLTGEVKNRISKLP